jgi:hypothetical protein
MKVIVLVVTLFLYGNIQENLTFLYPTTEACEWGKLKKEEELLGFPVERVEAHCELQDKQ